MLLPTQNLKFKSLKVANRAKKICLPETLSLIFSLSPLQSHHLELALIIQAGPSLGLHYTKHIPTIGSLHALFPLPIIHLDSKKRSCMSLLKDYLLKRLPLKTLVKISPATTLYLSILPYFSSYHLILL